jgi:hypothetical protein
MTQEEADREYSQSLEELDRVLTKAHTLSYRLIDGAKFYGQSKKVYEEGDKVFDAISSAQEMLIEFLDELPKRQSTRTDI